MTSSLMKRCDNVRFIESILLKSTILIMKLCVAEIKELYFMGRALFYILKKFLAVSVVSSATSAILIFFQRAIVCAT